VGRRRITASPPEKSGDLSVTALYTSQAWVWGKLKCAELFETPEGRAVFSWTNGALWIARLFSWQLRSLKHSLIARHVLIDRLLGRSKIQHVLELASGLSRRGAAVSEDPAVHYTEVDLPHVAQKKRELLARTDSGKAIQERPNWQLAEGDVTELQLETLLATEEPRFVIAEGLMMYFQPDEQRALWLRIAGLLSRGAGGVFAFDLVPWVEQPKPGPIGRALEWLMKRFTKGQSFERDTRTRQDIQRDLEAAGFDLVTPLEPCEVGADWSLPHLDVPTQQLVFVCYRGHALIEPGGP
jgi:O-methyltransferase involved in polyketide biosynthesis